MSGLMYLKSEKHTNSVIIAKWINTFKTNIFNPFTFTVNTFKTNTYVLNSLCLYSPPDSQSKHQVEDIVALGNSEDCTQLTIRQNRQLHIKIVQH